MYAQPYMDSEVLQRAGMMESRGVFILRKDDDVFDYFNHVYFKMAVICHCN